MDSPTDEALMEQFCTGDESALETLFERHGSKVHGYLTRMVRDPALAEDLLQTTFVSVVRARGRFDHGTRFAPWLMTIATNAARDALRRRRYADAYVADRLVSSPDSAPAQESDPSMRRHLERALQSLPEQQREAVVLHKVYGWSFEEIAVSLGISSGAARIRAHRGYERLRELLQPVVEG